MEEDIRSHIQVALACDLIYLEYQPQLNSVNKVVGVEALVRMTGIHGIIAPDQFISIAERSGQIDDVGNCVLTKACQQLKEWQINGIVDDLFTMSINVSGEQLDNINFNTSVCDVLNELELDPRNIVLELTESALINDVNIAKLHKFACNGIQISIDDFGTGYSSLSRLKHLPINEIKIDKVFVNDIAESSEDVAIMTAMYQLTKALNLHTVVEGVEEEKQLEILQEIGFKCFQGYYFSKPKNAEDVAEFIKQANSSHY